MDQINPIFSQTSRATAAVVKQKQQQKAPKDGQIMLACTLQNYLAKTVENGQNKNVPVDIVPATVMKTGVQDPSKTWPDSINMSVRLDALTPIDGMVERAIDPKTGETKYRVLFEIIHMGKKKDTFKFLEENAEHVYTHNDPTSVMLRNFVTFEGVPTDKYWAELYPDSTIKVTAPDRPKNNVLRERISSDSPVYKVQPGAPLCLYNVIAKAYVSLNTNPRPSSESDENPSAAGAAAEGDETTLSPDLRVYLKMECKGYVTLGEDYDPFMERSEREHATKAKDVHQLVPIERFRENTNSVPRIGYFYASGGYQTKYDPKKGADQKGVCIVREAAEEHNQLDMSNFLRTQAQLPWLKVNLDVFQFFGQVSADNYDRYRVELITKKSDTDLWRIFGINDPTVYGAIMVANRQLPIHLEGDLWASSVLSAPSNAADKVHEMNRMQGFYTYIIKTAVPDFVRYFKREGVRVTSDWVEREFQAACVVTGKGQKKIDLKIREGTKLNPLNVAGPLGNVMALGNGTTLPNPVTGEDEGMHHAWQGNLLPILERNEHSFFVLMSHPMTDEERGRYGQGEEGTPADEWIDALRQADASIYVWIYAVRKDAKMAPDYYLSKKKQQQLPRRSPRRSATPKRDASEHENSESDSSAVETPNRRTKRE